MTERDTDIEFDFFEEPETQEAARAPRAPARRPGRPPRPPAALLRLVGLVTFAIAGVILLVFWIQGCRSESKSEAYADYAGDVRAVATGSQAIGRDLNDLLTTPGIRPAALDTRLSGIIQQQELNVRRAQDIEPPGRLRAAHRHAVDALQLRVSGLGGLRTAFRETTRTQDARRAATLLAAQAQRLVASDVIWDDLFKDPAIVELQRQDISGVQIPDSNFVVNADLASTTAMERVWKRIRGASTGGTPTGLHGSGIVDGGTRALPGNQQLSTTSETIIEASTDLGFSVQVQNTGDSQEVRIVVRLTIQQSPPIVKRATIDVIDPGETKTVFFRDFPAVDIGERVAVKVEVEPVRGETNTANNTAEYPVIFSLGP